MVVKLCLMEELARWLEIELNKRSWSPSDLARQASLGNSTVTRILNGTRKAGPEVCVAMAKALGEPAEKVFRIAGLLPPLPASNDPLLQEINELLQNLPPEERQEVLAYVKFRYQRGQV